VGGSANTSEEAVSPMALLTALEDPTTDALNWYDCDLVIPVLNEETRIGDTIASLHEATTAASLNVRYIVVDNGCVDATADVVDAVRGLDVPIEFMSCQTRGKGAAVRAGIKRCTSRFVGYCDADRSTPPSAVERGLDLLRSGWEVVIGSRRCAGAGYTSPQPASRRLGSFAFHTIATRITGPMSDTQCGFKLFTGPVAQVLFNATTVNGFAFDVELLARARRAELRMIELPIQWSDSEGSTFRPVTDGLRSFSELRTAHRSLHTTTTTFAR
jgi:dolichyl-phosphate beta-glucosyltransferase